jgi:hypothetical protein
MPREVQGLLEELLLGHLNMIWKNLNRLLKSLGHTSVEEISCIYHEGTSRCYSEENLHLVAVGDCGFAVVCQNDFLDGEDFGLCLP